MECHDCGHEFTSRKCPACGWNPAPEEPGNPTPTRGTVRCFQCGASVERTGWCPRCLRFPSNVRPRRSDEQGHLVNPDGFCPTCMAFVLTELTYTPRGWTDTRTVQTRLTPVEFTAKMAALLRTLDRVKAVPERTARRSTASDREALRAEWAIVKRRMQEAEAKRQAEAVPH